MPGREPAEVLAEYAQEGGVFLLSDVLARASRKGSIHEAAAALWPLFTRLDLVSERVPGDLRLYKKTPSSPRTLSLSESKSLEAFFRRPSLPGPVEAAIHQYIEAKTGKQWNDPAVLQKIRRAVVSQKDEYWREGEKKQVIYRKGYHVLGYLAYHAPVYFIQVEHLMHDLASSGLLKQSIRVLDLGSGPGVVPLAIADFLGRIGNCSADIYAVEQSEEFIEAYHFLSGVLNLTTGPVILRPPIRADLHHLPLHGLPPSLDLIIMQNVLNEMTGLSASEKGGLVRGFAGALSDDGCILLVEPADKVNSIDLRKVAHHASGHGLFIHAPCRFLWNTPCIPDRCWSFVEKTPIMPTELMEALASGEEGYRYQNTDIKYSFVLLRKNPPPPVPCLPLSPRYYARLSTLDRHLNRRINVAAVVMSGNIGDDKTFVYRICDGTTKQPVYAILPAYHLSGRNRELLAMPYGSIAEFISVLVRFNSRYRAYNLLISRESGARAFDHRGDKLDHAQRPKRKRER